MKKLSTSQDEEIIIKMDVSEIVKRFLKENLIVWYGPNSESSENQKLLRELQVIADVKTFVDWQEAVKYLKQTEVPTCQVITSGHNSELFVKEISQLKNIYSIHVYCENIEDYKKWTNQYSKVVSVDTDFHQLKDNLKKHLRIWQKKVSSLRTNLPVFGRIFDDSDKSRNTYLHFYLKGFVHFLNRSQAKTDLMNLARALYRENNDMDDFEKNYKKYSMKDILWWYTRESFLYKITNNCLRIATSDAIQYCRLVLRDLEQAIKEVYQHESKNFSGLLYRGAFVSDQEWTALVLNIGKEIEFYGFLSTSKTKTVAFSYIKGATDKKIFITVVMPAAPEKGEQGFAEIEKYSKFKSENEVLFNVMSRFTILEAKEDIIEGIKCRHLVLLYGAQAMRGFTSKLLPIQIKTQELKRCHICGVEISLSKSPVVLVNPSKCDECSCLDCLEKCQTGKNHALISIPTSMSTKSRDLNIEGFVMEYKNELNIPFYRSECEKCKIKNLKYCAKCRDCERKKNYCESCFYQNDCIHQGHLLILETHPFSFWSEKMSEQEKRYLSYYNQQLEFQTSYVFQQALIFTQANEHDRAIEYYNKFLNKYGIKHDAITAASYSNLGKAYYDSGKYEEAIKYICKALEIQKSVLSYQHQDVAFSYTNLGNAYQGLGYYQQSIKSYSEALKIQKIVFGNQHPETASSHNNLGIIYTDSGDYQKAIRSFSEALEIQKKNFGDHHPDLAFSLNNMGNPYFKLGDYDKAIEFYSKALEIRKTIFGDQHGDTASCYNNLGNVYSALGKYEKALQSYSKALEIRKTVLGDQHAYTATSYNNLGNVYIDLGEYQKALQLYSKALEIRKKVLGTQHKHTASSHDNLGIVYSELREHEKAMQSYSEALEIRKKVLGDFHPDTAKSYEHVGHVYITLGKNKVAMQFCSKALQIRKTIWGEKHVETANSYHSLGNVYEGLKEFQKAIDNYSKALEIQKITVGDRNSNTPIYYYNLGNAYKGLGKKQEAIECLAKAYEIAKMILGDEHPKTMLIFLNLSELFNSA